MNFEKKTNYTSKIQVCPGHKCLPTFRDDQEARICASKMAARKTTKATEANPAITVYTLGQ